MKPLILLTFFLIASSFLAAQPAARSLATGKRFTSSNGLVKKTSKSTLQAGPKVKNPLAAGRAGCPEVVIIAANRPQPKGPKYKNMKRAQRSDLRRVNTINIPRKRLTGPRVKNRTAMKPRRQF